MGPKNKRLSSSSSSKTGSPASFASTSEWVKCPRSLQLPAPYNDLHYHVGETRTHQLWLEDAQEGEILHPSHHVLLAGLYQGTLGTVRKKYGNCSWLHSLTEVER